MIGVQWSKKFNDPWFETTTETMEFSIKPIKKSSITWLQRNVGRERDKKNENL